jgi:thymidylate kinase
MTKIVVCLEGCHAAGKTTLLKLIEKSKYKIINENFLNNTKCKLGVQSLTMEALWMMKWIEYVISLPDNEIYISDRGPLSSIIYTKYGSNLLDALIIMINELKQIDINVVNFYIKVDEKKLWNRIQNRLKVEPNRKQYNEDSYNWMKNVIKQYEEFSWDIIIENNESINDIYNIVMKQINSYDYLLKKLFKKETF